MSLSTTPWWWSRTRGAATRQVPPGVAGRVGWQALLGAGATAGTLLVAAVSPERPGHYPVCPTYAVTGFYCPACGGLRAVHALTHGDLGLALHRNPLVVLALPFAVWAYLAWVRRRVLGRPATWFPPVWLRWALLAVVVAFTVLRNVPGFGVLAP